MVVCFVEGLSTQWTKDKADLQNTTQNSGVEFTCSGSVGSPCTTLEDTNGSKSKPENEYNCHIRERQD